MALVRGSLDSIRCDEQNYLIWKWRPQGNDQKKNEDRSNQIRYGSSLSVRDGSVAVFVYPQLSGDYEDFIEGPYEGIIETENFPVLANIVGIAYNGGTPFPAEVYYINLANLIQIKFGVPYFPVYDGRVQGIAGGDAVPVAVRGSLNFKISDYREFVKLHRLDDFNIDDFRLQIKDAVVRYVKDIVSKAPKQFNIPVGEIDTHISDVNDLVKEKVAATLKNDFGVTVSRLDISDIEIDKTSPEWQKYVSHTETKGFDFANKLNATFSAFRGNRAATSRFTAELKRDTPSVESGLEEFGKKVSNAFESAIDGIKNAGKTATPPPIPVTQYYVAVEGKQTGPFGMDVLAQMASAGTLTEDSLVWKKGMKTWEKAGTIKELQTILQQGENETPPPITQ